VISQHGRQGMVLAAHSCMDCACMSCMVADHCAHTIPLSYRPHKPMHTPAVQANWVTQAVAHGNAVCGTRMHSCKVTYDGAEVVEPKVFRPCDGCPWWWRQVLPCCDALADGGVDALENLRGTQSRQAVHAGSMGSKAPNTGRTGSTQHKLLSGIGDGCSRALQSVQLMCCLVMCWCQGRKWFKPLKLRN
jgi:hypothetical protein